MQPSRAISESSPSEHSARPSWRTTIHAAFDRVVERFPLSAAVEQGGQVRTYEEVGAASRRLASRLTAAGVRSGDVVGVCVGRSSEFVVTLLAILRCGAAYAPLPGEYPLPRLLGMLEDASVRVLVADAAAAPLASRLERGRAGIVRVAIDVGSVWAGDPPEAASTETGIDPESPAYVMFTSGSTGRPRGVVIPHRGVTGLVLGQSFADFGPGLRTLLLAPTAFDASTFEVWAPLLHGGAVVVYPDDDFDPVRLGDILGAGRVNCLWLTAGLFNLVVDLVPSALAGVNHVLTGGDVLSIPHVRRAFAALPGIRITNGYGPTETTTFACTHAIDPADPFPEGTIPIGRSLAHTECLIVDETGKPVPDGVEGELLIGGSGVTLGYLSGERTQFLVDPRGAESGLWYRSGDRCRRRADGALLFLGRGDREVKIRGHRVDPAELEAILAGHPLLRAAAVVPYGPAGDRSLGVAIVRCDGGTDPVRGLREWLAERVPPALVPARIMSVQTLPVTANGKLDRDAMRDMIERSTPDPSPWGPDSAVNPPRGPVEPMVAELWQELLGVPAVGRDDDFFDRGGNSLFAMRLVTRIERATGVRLPVRTVFDRPRLADFARAVAQYEGANESFPAAASTPPLDGSVDMPALPAQRGMWALHERLSDRATYNQPFAYRLGAAIDPEALRSALVALSTRHPALRTCLLPTPAGPIQRVFPAGEMAIDWVVERGVGPESIDAALRDRARRPFDLAAPPLWRVTFFPDAAPHGVLLFVFHHAIIDDWSVSLFLDELAALASGIVAPSPAPACWIATLSPARRETLLGYWQAELDGVQATLRLPGGRSGEGTGTPGAIQRRRLDGAAVEAKRAARAAGCTIAQWLVAAFHAWLQRITVATDVVVLTPLSLRGNGVAEDAFGCCLNTVPVRVRWRDDADGGRPAEGTTLPELAGWVRRAMVDAGDYGDFPFDEIVADGSAVTILA